MLERTVLSFSAMIVMSKVAFNAGSSKHGNARRASGAFLFFNLLFEYFLIQQSLGYRLVQTITLFGPGNSLKNFR